MNFYEYTHSTHKTNPTPAELDETYGFPTKPADSYDKPYVRVAIPENFQSLGVEEKAVLFGLDAETIKRLEFVVWRLKNTQ